ncbi:hypothetical protein ACFFU9_04975 [Mariniflexile ostreae]|uniref:Uncharacterized protein n=1 Tax=Mariniflexile ostreae TaxID=1520892 RepID=A0ABV5F9J2_9FLAO
MKRLLFMLCLSALISCKNDTKQDDSFRKEVVQDHQDTNTLTQYHNDWVADMELDEGAKWQANVATNQGVIVMQDVLKTQATVVIEDYHKLAAQLGEAKNDVVKNCTMQGPSHDFLHIWLLPLMEKIEALSEVQDVEEASKIKQSIKENIAAYHIYFQ